MLMPKKTKYRKVQRGRMKGISKGARTIEFGDYGLVAVEPAWISARQIESLRISISRKIKKVGALFLRVFPDKPITKKPAETRMGKGKGMPDHWVAVIKKGKILFEMDGVPLEIARECMRIAAHKIPLRTKFITRVSH